MHESIVFCSTCTMSSQRKFTFAISSPDEFLVRFIPKTVLFITLITKAVCMVFFAVLYKGRNVEQLFCL